LNELKNTSFIIKRVITDLVTTQSKNISLTIINEATWRSRTWSQWNAVSTHQEEKATERTDPGISIGKYRARSSQRLALVLASQLQAKRTRWQVQIPYRLRSTGTGGRSTSANCWKRTARSGFELPPQFQVITWNYFKSVKLLAANNCSR
jgi:hypothetical protein